MYWPASNEENNAICGENLCATLRFGGLFRESATEIGSPNKADVIFGFNFVLDITELKIYDATAWRQNVKKKTFDVVYVEVGTSTKLLMH